MKVIVSASILLVSFVVFSQNQELTLEDIYKKGKFRAERFQSVRWMKDNTGYSALETNKMVGGKDIIRYDAENGARSVILSADKLIPEGRSEL